jgi:hypothetical protein
VSDAQTIAAMSAALLAMSAWYLILMFVVNETGRVAKDAPPTFAELLAAGGTVK